MRPYTGKLANRQALRSLRALRVIQPAVWLLPLPLEKFPAEPRSHSTGLRVSHDSLSQSLTEMERERLRAGLQPAVRRIPLVALLADAFPSQGRDHAPPKHTL